MANPASKRPAAPVEETLFIVMLGFSLAGVAVTDFSPDDAFMYWMAMIFVFGLAAIVAGWQTARRHYELRSEGSEVKELFVTQSLHWLGSLVAVVCLFGFVEAGRLGRETAGLMVLLLLALTTYLDGIRIGWRFCLVGMYLAAAAVAAGFLESFMPWLSALAVAVAAFTVWREKRKALPEEEAE